MRSRLSEPLRRIAGWRACAAGFFIAALTVLGGTTQAPAASCTIPALHREVQSIALVKTLRCLIESVDRLESENIRLKRRVSALENLAGDLPADWSNVDGKINEEPDRPIAGATFTLSSRLTGGSNALPIDQRVMEELCDRSGGCTLVIFYKQLGLFNGDPNNSVIAGPCQFTYAQRSGDWAIGAGCGANQAQSGNDGDGGLGGDKSKSAEIAIAGGACVLSDSGLAKTVGDKAALASDRSKGLFLIAMPARQENGGERFQCELALR